MNSIYHILPFISVYLPAVPLYYALFERRVEQFFSVSVVSTHYQMPEIIYMFSQFCSANDFIYITTIFPSNSGRNPP